MQRMLTTTTAKFIELQPIGIVAAIFLSGIVSLLTFTALECNNWANTFFRSHLCLPDFPTLFDYFGNDASANRQATFADGKL